MKYNFVATPLENIRGLCAAVLIGNLACLVHSEALGAPNLTPASQGIIDCTAAHLKKNNPGLAGNPDKIICFEGYVSNFNTATAKKVEGKSLHWAVPHWVAHLIARAPSAPESHDRPDAWFTVPELQQQGLAPTDDSYAFPKNFVRSIQIGMSADIWRKNI